MRKIPDAVQQTAVAAVALQTWDVVKTARALQGPFLKLLFMSIQPVTQTERIAAIALLRNNNLPTEDISATTQLFCLKEEEQIVGTIGLAHDGNNALLRSPIVAEEKRNLGLGVELVEHVEAYAKSTGIQSIYLLTTTAAPFFAKRGYQAIDRASVPPFLLTTSEFASVCPASATVMKKEF
jgi:amino-acid N-acetyltransferase